MTQIAPPDIPPSINPIGLRQYFQHLNSWIFQSLKNKIDINEATHGVILVSPAGKVWRITVTDAGAVTTTAVPLGSHP
jgi:hypothetical protein